MDDIHYATFSYDVKTDIVRVSRQINGDWREVVEFPQREGGFGDRLMGLAEAYEDAEVSHYSGPWTEGVPRLPDHGEVDVYTVRIAGTKEEIQGYVSAVAEAGFGLPTSIKGVSTWRHPIASLLGYNDVAEAAAELRSDYREVRVTEVLEDGRSTRSTVTFEPREG